MIIRRDNEGVWSVVSSPVMPFGGTMELEIALQDSDCSEIDPASLGSAWSVSLTTPSSSAPATLATGTLVVDGMMLAGPVDMSGEGLYLYCAERCRSVVMLRLQADGAEALAALALVSYDKDNCRPEPLPPCRPGGCSTGGGVTDAYVAKVMGEHNADASAHPGITNGFQPLIDQANPLPALYVSGLDPVATSGSYAQLKNVPETFTPSSHTHAKADITDFSVNWQDLDNVPLAFPPEAHSHIKSDISDFGVSWSEVTSKPETFTPSSHKHTKSDISDLSLSWSDITGKPETFAPSSHVHSKADITDLSLGWNDITGKPETFTPSSHTHTTADVSQPVTAIPAATAEYTLVDKGAYTHVPSSSPIYTLPAVSSSTVAHGITVEVSFTGSVLSVAFVNAQGAIVDITPDIVIATRDVWRFICVWTVSGWAVKAVRLGGD